MRKTVHNSGFAKKRVQWLIEHSTSHQLLCYVDSFVLRNPLLRKAAKRYAPFKRNRMKHLSVLLFSLISIVDLVGQNSENLPILDYNNRIADSIKKELGIKDSIYIIGKEYFGDTHSYEFIVFNKKSVFYEILYKRFNNRQFDTVFFNNYYHSQYDTMTSIEKFSLPRKMITKWVPVYKYFDELYVYNDCEFQTIFELTDSTFNTYNMDGPFPTPIKSVINTNSSQTIILSNNVKIRFELIDKKRLLYMICHSGRRDCSYFTSINNLNEFYLIEHHCHDESSNLVEFERIEYKQ